MYSASKISRLRGHGAGTTHLLCELYKEFLVEKRVHIGWENIKYPPVTEVNFFADALTSLDRQKSRRQVQQSRPYHRDKNDQHSIYHQSDQHDGQYEEPEPDENVCLFVDDVQR